MEFDAYKRLVQKLWPSKSSNGTAQSQPIYCLGKAYNVEAGDNDNSTQPLTHDGHDIDSLAATKDYLLSSSDSTHGYPPGFLRDFESRVGMTYRSDFPPIPKSTDPKALSMLSLPVRIRSQLVDHNGFTTDSGWGCMIRSGQSLLANTIFLQSFGRDWRRGKLANEERFLLSLFADDPRAPFSIHNFVQHGAAVCGKYPGEWFGPSATARCIQHLATCHAPSNLSVYFTGDYSEIDEASFLKVANTKNKRFQPTLLLVGTRLGTDKINACYWQGLQACLQMPQSVGIAGGRPSSSHYFIGTQGEYLFYLDPHNTRPALSYREDPSTYGQHEIDSYYATKLCRLHLSDMDPSMLIGFLIRNEDEWVDWKRHIREIQGTAPITLSQNPLLQGGPMVERASAIDEVESLSDGDNQ